MLSITAEGRLIASEVEVKQEQGAADSMVEEASVEEQEDELFDEEDRDEDFDPDAEEDASAGVGLLVPGGEPQEVHCGAFPEKQRRLRRNWWLWALIGGAVLGIGFYLLGRFLPEDLRWGRWIAPVVWVVMLGVAYASYSQSLTYYYKNHIVPQCVNLICTRGRYDPSDGIEEDVFMSSGLYSRWPDRYKTEDLVCGRIGRTWFRFAEVQAQEERRVETKNGTRSTWVDIFRGFFFEADFNKHFRGQTTLVPNFWGAKWLAGRQRVSLENQALMKAFLVCSTDQVEARYILTPSLMERIMLLWKRYPEQLSISFTGSRIMIARKTSHNHYEMGLWRSLRRCVECDTAAIRGLTAIVEELNMNTRIWTKE